MLEEVREVLGNRKRLRSDHPAVEGVAGWLHIEPHGVGEESSEGFQNPAGELPVVAFSKKLTQQGHAEHDAGAGHMPLS